MAQKQPFGLVEMATINLCLGQIYPLEVLNVTIALKYVIGAPITVLFRGLVNSGLQIPLERQKKGN